MCLDLRAVALAIGLDEASRAVDGAVAYAACGTVEALDPAP